MERVKWYKSISFKLQIPIFAIVFACISSFIFYNYYMQMIEMKENLHKQMKNNYSQVEELIENSSMNALGIAAWIAQSRNIQEVFENRDREKLKDLTLETYQNIKQVANIDQFQFHLPPAISFLRLHQPDKFGDDLSSVRPTIIAANSTLKNIKGLERGRYGFGIRGLAPIFSNGKHIGSVEIGAALNDAFLQKLKNQYQLQVAIGTIENENANIFAKNFDFSNQANLQQAMIAATKSSNTTEIQRKSGNKDIYSFVGPLRDFSGKADGFIVIEQDITAQVNNIHNMVIKYVVAAMVSIILVGITISFVIRNLLMTRISRFQNVFKNASEGDLTVRSRVFREDEMGSLGKMLNMLTDNLSGAIKSISAEARAVDESSTSMQQLTAALFQETETSAKNAINISQKTEHINQDITAIAAAMEQLHSNTEHIAQSASHLTSTIKKIVLNTDTAKKISSSAVSKVDSASERVDQLGQAAMRISKVSDAINEISEQTNLLALNATIEAARAGDAGKGFAVVAGEIKELARQTVNATSEIKENIKWIQNSTSSTVSDIKEISTVINEIDEIVILIATAVDSQTLAITEIDTNIAEGVNAIQEVTGKVTNTSVSTEEAFHEVDTIGKSLTTISQNSSKLSIEAQQLAGLASKLYKLIGKFKTE